MALTFINRLKICIEVLTARSGHGHQAQEKQLTTFQRGYAAGYADGATTSCAVPASGRSAGAELLYSGEGYYCVACECLCEMYDQGLSCSCGDPWETEVCDPDYYQDKWVRVKVEARRI